MDWTGGTRRRFTGAKNSNTSLKKQKAHFAKARAASNQDSVASHLNPLPSSKFKLDDSIRTVEAQHRGSSRWGANAHRANHSATSSRGSNRKGSAPVMHDASDTQQEVEPAGLTANPRIRNDEELMLLANRRKLLARSDWLALEPTRPLRLNFPATSDTGRVGRRKKIKRASAKASKPAQQRLLTPLFEERLDTMDYMMTGALPMSQDGKIEIKVGTDAFGSQTCPSRRSHVSRNSSMSTALSRFSEESMLLGADGDTFDADLVEVPPFRVRQESVQPSEHGDQMSLYETGRSTQATRGHSPAYSNQAQLQEHTACPPGEHAIMTAKRYPQIDLPDDRVLVDAPYNELHISELQRDTDSPKRYSERSSPDIVEPADRTDPDSDAEDAWRRMMGIATQVASSASIKALNSLSEHVTTSGTPHAATLDLVELFDIAVSTPMGKPSRPSTCGSEDDFVPLVGSHHRKEALPAATQLPVQEDENGESLWREFIIGSEDSKSEDELHSAWQRKRKRRMSSSDQSRSLQLSGLGTSDKATQGGTVAISSPGLVAYTEANEDDQLHKRSQDTDDMSSVLAAVSRGPQNIHARSAERRDPKQQLKRARRQ